MRTIFRPEATGVIAAAVYILLLMLFAPLPYLSHLLSPSLPSSFSTLNATAVAAASLSSTSVTNLDGSVIFPHHSFATYLASLLSLLTATFLGFLDDVFDIRWRWKLPIPGTSILLPHQSITLKKMGVNSDCFSAVTGDLCRRSRNN